MELELLSPEKLYYFIPLAFGVVGLAVICLKKRELRESRSLILRTLCLALLVVAYADPVKKSSESSEQVSALVDLSSSITDEGMKAFVTRIKEFLENESALKVSLYPFSKSVRKDPIIVDSETDEGRLLSELKSRAPGLDRGETDIGSAIQLVGNSSQGGNVLLLSDGNENLGNAREAARSLASIGGRIYPLIPDEAPFRSQSLELAMLSTPLTAKAGDLVEVRVSARNTTSQNADGTLEVTYDDKPILSQRISVSGNEEKLLLAKSPPVEGGLHRIKAKLRNSNGISQELHRWVSARKKAKLLLLSGTTDDERVIKELLTLKGYSLESVVGDGKHTFPKTFSETSGIIFNNISEQQLPRGFLAEVKSFSEKGGGVLIIGGDRSFGLGNYINTPLEEISPLKFVPPQTQKKRLVKAVALVIDKSRSMSFDGKIEGARDAALMAIRSLQDEDYVSVIGFDATAFVVIRMAQAGEIKSQAQYRLANLVAMGKTELLPALIEARRGLSKAPADRKHIIVLSDGKVPFAGEEYIQELSRLRQEGITLSGVALGDDADAPFMQMLAQYGRGAFYQTLSSSRLPDIFIQDIKVSTGEKTMKERSEFPIGIGPSGLQSTDIERFPLLRGYVETLPKKGSSIELITKGETQVSPLLASWKFGAGKVIVFTSDANGRWSYPWLNWEGFSRFWSQLVEEVENAPDENVAQIDFDLRSSVNRKSLYLDLAVFDPKLKSAAAPRITAEVTLPGGEKRSISFLPEKKGRFKGEVEGARPGDYRVNILYGKDKLPEIGLTLDGGLFGEVSGRGINRESLAELASLTGGVVNPSPAELTRQTKVVERAEHLFPPLIILSFLLFLFEVILREIGVAPFVRKISSYLWRVYPKAGRKRVRNA